VTVEVRPTTWATWRGSEDLLAHVFRTAVKAATVPGSDPPICLVDIAVQGDHETFTSPQAFLDDVTREALTQFQSIMLTVEGPAVSVRFEMRREGSRWFPARSGTVSLEVTGREEDAVATATARMRPAVERGVAGRWRHLLTEEVVDQGSSFLVLLLVLVLLAIVWDDTLLSWRGALVLVPTIVAAEYLRRVLYPHLEIWPQGTSSAFVRLRRLVLGLVGTLTVGLVSSLLEGALPS
jgi:hypothetical protein